VNGSHKTELEKIFLCRVVEIKFKRVGLLFEKRRERAARSHAGQPPPQNAVQMVQLTVRTNMCSLLVGAKESPHSNPSIVVRTVSGEKAAAIIRAIIIAIMSSEVAAVVIAAGTKRPSVDGAPQEQLSLSKSEASRPRFAESAVSFTQEAFQEIHLRALQSHLSLRCQNQRRKADYCTEDIKEGWNNVKNIHTDLALLNDEEQRSKENPNHALVIMKHQAEQDDPTETQAYEVELKSWCERFNDVATAHLEYLTLDATAETRVTLEKAVQTVERAAAAWTQQQDVPLHFGNALASAKAELQTLHAAHCQQELFRKLRHATDEELQAHCQEFLAVQATVQELGHLKSQNDAERTQNCAIAGKLESEIIAYFKKQMRYDAKLKYCTTTVRRKPTVAVASRRPCLRKPLARRRVKRQTWMDPRWERNHFDARRFCTIPTVLPSKCKGRICLPLESTPFAPKNVSQNYEYCVCGAVLRRLDYEEQETT